MKRSDKIRLNSPSFEVNQGTSLKSCLSKKCVDMLLNVEVVSQTYSPNKYSLRSVSMSLISTVSLKRHELSILLI